MGRDGYTGLVVLAASLALFWGTLGLERHPMVPVGPAFYPRIVLGVVALMALMLVVADVWGRRRLGTQSPVVPAQAGTQSPNYLLVVIAFAIFTLYVVALPYLGFRLASFLFLVALPVALEPPADVRRWIVVLALAVAATLVTHYVFEHYLHVLLPRGRWTSF
jgi:putative tricarboxylic transport membrane protein